MERGGPPQRCFPAFMLAKYFFVLWLFYFFGVTIAASHIDLSTVDCTGDKTAMLTEFEWNVTGCSAGVRD